MTIRRLQAAFDDWRGNRQPLVLASVYETRGSTYSKAGARMLVTGDGRFQGMLSGGCLEGDLAERAQAVLESGTPEAVSYDLGSSDEELWGLGVGCDGTMRIFLQPLLPEADYQPFAAMADILAGDATGVALTVLNAGGGSLAAGATQLVHDHEVQAFGIPPEHRDALTAIAREAMASHRSQTRAVDLGGTSVELLAALLLPPPRVLILGAGLDAAPVLRFAIELGWRVTIQDHRPAYIAGGTFERADQVMCEPVERLAERLDLDRYDAVIVMSHHLASDRSYLRQLASTSIPYIGLLGPRERRRRLMADLGSAAESLSSRLHGPAGLDIGADGPASIALSIVAEIHERLMTGNPR